MELQACLPFSRTRQWEFDRRLTKNHLAQKEWPPGLKFEHIKSVLIVDDDLHFIGHLSAVLKKEGLRVKSVSNCLDALHIVSYDIPDLFLIDLVMPTITGDRLCKILQRQPQLAGSYRILLAPRADDAGIDLESVDAHACVAKEPWKTMTQNLFSVLRKLDTRPNQEETGGAQKFDNQKKALKEKLQHAQKMEAIGTLAGGIAHDFNNILQTILGYAQLSLFEPRIPAEVRKNLEEIQTSAQSATSLIRRLLVFSRKVDSQHRPIDLNQQINHVAQMLKRTIPRMIRIELRLDQGLKLIRADGNLLKQILMNLGVNARDAMPEGGCLRFQTRNVTLNAIFCADHPGARPGTYVQLMVSDTGIGMTDKVREQIFDPFFTTKKSGQGTGLGLAMAYGMVKDLAGFITCNSKLGQGTVFTLYFPAIDTIVDTATPHAAEKENLRGGTETLLLIDDEKTIRNFGRQLLERYGYTVITAQSGEEALDIYRRRTTRIDLAIVDLSMPGMGGVRCIEYLREIHPDCRIIISSGYAAKDQIKSALAAGAQEFITKPYTVRDLLAKIHNVINLP